MLKNRALFGLSVTDDEEDCCIANVVMLAESGRWAPLLPIPPDGGGCWLGDVVVALDDEVVDRVGGGVFFSTLPVLLLFELSRGVVVVVTTATLLGVVSFAVEDDDAV